MKVSNIPFCIGLMAAMFFPYAVKSNNEEFEDYCRFGDDHLLCKSQTISEDCGDEHEQVLITNEVKKIIVDEHNKARNEVALGTARGLDNKPFQQASNMREISWDNLLALAAQKLTNRCSFTPTTDQQRLFPFFKENLVGEYTLFEGGNKKPPIITSELILKYVNDAKSKYDTTILYQTPKGKQPYTQMVWAETYLVGCAATRFAGPFNGSESAHIFLGACIYGPAGGLIDKTVYLNGTACSKCPNGSPCSSTYKGLCSSDDVEPLSKHFYPKGFDSLYIGGSKGLNRTTEFSDYFIECGASLTKEKFWYLLVAFVSVFLA